MRSCARRLNSECGGTVAYSLGYGSFILKGTVSVCRVRGAAGGQYKREHHQQQQRHQAAQQQDEEAAAAAAALPYILAAATGGESMTGGHTD